MVGGTTDSIAAFLASGARGEGDAVSYRGKGYLPPRLAITRERGSRAEAKRSLLRNKQTNQLTSSNQLPPIHLLGELARLTYF